MTPLLVPLTGWRNAPFPLEEFAFTDDGTPRPLAGMSFRMDVRDPQRLLAPLIRLRLAADDAVDGIRIRDATGGVIRFQIGQAAMQAAWDAAFAAGLQEPGHRAELVYDTLAIHPDRLSECWMEGPFIINPGVTQWT